MPRSSRSRRDFRTGHSTVPDKVAAERGAAGRRHQGAGSAKEYEAAKIAGDANPPDWFPDEHPAAPRVVTGGQGVDLRVARAI